MFLLQNSLEQRVKLAQSRKGKRSMEVIGGAAAVGTAVIAGAALGAALGGADFGDFFSSVADIGNCDCAGCDGLFDLFTACSCI